METLLQLSSRKHRSMQQLSQSAILDFLDDQNDQKSNGSLLNLMCTYVMLPTQEKQALQLITTNRMVQQVPAIYTSLAALDSSVVHQLLWMI